MGARPMEGPRLDRGQGFRPDRPGDRRAYAVRCHRPRRTRADRRPGRVGFVRTCDGWSARSDRVHGLHVRRAVASLDDMLTLPLLDPVSYHRDTLPELAAGP